MKRILHAGAFCLVWGMLCDSIARHDDERCNFYVCFNNQVGTSRNEYEMTRINDLGKGEFLVIFTIRRLILKKTLLKPQLYVRHPGGINVKAIKSIKTFSRQLLHYVCSVSIGSPECSSEAFGINGL
jgi:hypothetical protein